MAALEAPAYRLAVPVLVAPLLRSSKHRVRKYVESYTLRDASAEAARFARWAADLPDEKDSQAGAELAR
jgi:hypothetical protein